MKLIQAKVVDASKVTDADTKTFYDQNKDKMKQPERLLAHGIAHCRGHDHQTAREARKMAAAEEEMLGARGMVGDSLTTGRSQRR